MVIGRPAGYLKLTNCHDTLAGCHDPVGRAWQLEQILLPKSQHGARDDPTERCPMTIKIILLMMLVASIAAGSHMRAGGTIAQSEE